MGFYPGAAKGFYLRHEAALAIRGGGKTPFATPGKTPIFKILGGTPLKILKMLGIALTQSQKMRISFRERVDSNQNTPIPEKKKENKNGKIRL